MGGAGDCRGPRVFPVQIVAVTSSGSLSGSCEETLDSSVLGYARCCFSDN